MTEKLFKVMNSFIIPVVFSGADLSSFAPPKSYIDANAFETVEELANHLNFLSTNPDEYVKYFWWRDFYKVSLKSLLDFPSEHWCEVCQKINKLREEKKEKVYQDIEKWNKKDICEKAKIKF